MDERNKISIIIPVYNSQKYIKETLDSVLKQTYDNYEIIIINDGSVDDSENIIKSYNNPKIKYFKQSNAGQSAARNNGLKYVTGEYICFLDSDDILVSDCLSNLMNAIKEKDSDISVCGYEKFRDSTGEKISKRIPKDWEIEFDDGIKHVFIYSPWAKLYKTSFIQKYDLRFSEGELLEDGPYCCLAHLLANNVATVNRIGLRYRVRDNSTMGNVRKKNNKPLPPYKAVRILIEEFYKYNDNDSKIPVMEYCTVKILAGLVTNMYKNIDKESRKEICAYCHSIMKEYFGNVKRNKYIRINALKKLPRDHRVAVRLFVFFNGLNLLYPFSLCTSVYLKQRPLARKRLASVKRIFVNEAQ